MAETVTTLTRRTLLLPLGAVRGPRLTALLTTLLLAAAPATALADGAGDQQYQDPLTAPSAPHKKKKPAATTAPATTAPAAGTAPATPAAATAPAAAAQPAGQLPRTGSPAGLLRLGRATLIA